MKSPVIFLLFATAMMGLTFAKDCLECYQCSDYRDYNSYCDDYRWHALIPSKLEALVIGCPPEASEYCIKKETNITGNRLTERGCIGGRDSAGNELVEGCIENLKANPPYKYCFCSTPLCNSSSFYGGVYLCISAFSILAFVIKRCLLV